MDFLLPTIRHTWRSAMKKPGFTLVVLLTLGIGIGACTTMFSIVNAVLLRPLPYSEPEKLFVVRNAMPSLGFPDSDVSEGEFKRLREEQKSCEYLAAWTWGNAALRGVGEPERVKAPSITPDFFRVLGVQPILGRDFARDEEGGGRHRLVILSHSFWQRKFTGDPNVVGRALTLDNEAFTVIGVLPKGFKTPDELQVEGTVDLWRGYGWNPEVPGRGSNYLTVIGRLRAGVTIDAAQAEVAGSLTREVREFPNFYPPDITCHVVPLGRWILGDVRQALYILLAAVAAVLLIACANVANLFLVRVEERHHEMALRTALGADRRRLAGMVLVESLTFSLVGAVFGLMLAQGCIQLVLAVSPGNIPRLSETTIDFRMAGFAILVAVLTGLAFGFFPALQSARGEPQGSLRESGRGLSGSRGGGRFRKALIALEMALAVVLLTSAGLLVRSFQEILKVETGYRPDHLLTMRLTPPSEKYKAGQVTDFYNQVLDRTRSLPGVTEVGLSDLTPLDGNLNNTVIEIEGRPFDMNRIAGMNVAFRTANEGYIQASGMTLVQGRGIEAPDRETTPLVAVINEAFARRYWPGENPIGKRFRLLDAPPAQATTKFLEVVGVTRDTKNQSLTEEVKPEAFVPFRQASVSLGKIGNNLEFTLLARTSGDPVALTPAVKGEIQKLEPEIIFTRVKSLEQVLASTIVLPKFYMALLGAFAVISLCLGAIGTYGVISYTVARRTHEIGVRMALGASTGAILSMVIRQGMTVAFLGIAIGLAGAFAVTRVMKSLLFGVTATDPATFFSISSLLIGVGLLACWIPARRASRTDPMIALRNES